MRPATSTSTIGSRLARNSSVDRVPPFSHNHDILIESRPITAVSMVGMKTGLSLYNSNSNANTGRRLLPGDASNFAPLLRSKQEAIKNEIGSLGKDIAHLKQRMADAKNAEENHKELLESIEELEGIFKDYNLTFDKHRDGTGAEKIAEFCKTIALHNRAAAEEVDQICLKKIQIERDNTQVEAHMSDFFVRAERLMQQEKPEKAGSFHQLLNKSNNLSKKIEAEEIIVAKLRDKVYLAERSDGTSEQTFRADYKRHQEQIKILDTKLALATNDIEILQMKPDDARTLQVEKIKQLQRNLSILDESIGLAGKTKGELQELQWMLGAQEEYLETFFPLLDDKNVSDARADSSPQNSKDAMLQLQTERERLNVSIVDMLECISHSIAMNDQDFPTASEYEELKISAMQKIRSLETCQKTIESLQNQKTKRLQELEKAGKIEDSMQNEITNLIKNTNLMATRIKKFEDISGLRECYEKEKLRLPSLSARYDEKKHEIDEDAGLVSSNLERMRLELEKNQTWCNLKNLEKSLGEQGQTVFSLNDYVSQMNIQMDYLTVKSNCSQIVEQLNLLHAELECA